jgi:AraC family transcriptional regulator of adaptative response / methylphosphotriester-DNA alkyltransferase methyltransferase
MRDGTVERRKALFEEAKEIIRREYPQDLELDQVARRLATSRRQLQRSFAEIGNTSFRSYVAEVRMQRALELLQDGSMPVRDVASSVGYRQPAQFAKTFRRHHGRPPSSFRREGRSATAADPREPGEVGGNLDGGSPSLAYGTASA